jgi:hypothetical protein
VLERAGAEPEELYATLRDLRAALARAIQTLGIQGDGAPWAAARHAVLAAAKDQLLVERAWTLAQGWEPDPQAVPPIETLLK